jgi:hypothetical protein
VILPGDHRLGSVGASPGWAMLVPSPGRRMNVERAVAAAQAIVAATESYRKTPLAVALGRTRICIETGTAIVAMSVAATKSISPPSATW